MATKSVTVEQALGAIQAFYDSVDSTSKFSPKELKAWGALMDLLPEEVECCDHCNEQVRHVGEDGLSYCENCGIVEGNTHQGVANE